MSLHACCLLAICSVAFVAAHGKDIPVAAHGKDIPEAWGPSSSDTAVSAHRPFNNRAAAVAVKLGPGQGMNHAWANHMKGRLLTQSSSPLYEAGLSTAACTCPPPPAPQSSPAPYPPPPNPPAPPLGPFAPASPPSQDGADVFPPFAPYPAQDQSPPPPAHVGKRQLGEMEAVERTDLLPPSPPYSPALPPPSPPSPQPPPPSPPACLCPLTNNQQQVELTFSGATYSSLSSNTTAWDRFTSTVVAQTLDFFVITAKYDRSKTSVALQSLRAGGRRRLHAGSVVANEVVTLPPGTNSTAATAVMQSFQSAMGSQFPKSFLDEFGITGISAVLLNPSYAPLPSSTDIHTDDSSKSGSKYVIIGAAAGGAGGVCVIAGIAAFLIIRRRRQSIQAAA